MKRVIIFILVVNSLLLATSDVDSAKKSRIKKQIQKEIEKEKKYSKEKIFYSEKNYDFKGSEINTESLKSLPEIKVDDLDMDSVYD